MTKNGKTQQGQMYTRKRVTCISITMEQRGCFVYVFRSGDSLTVNKYTRMSHASLRRIVALEAHGAD